MEDLESKINIKELNIILDASRKKEHQHRRFLAAMQGVDLDAGQQSTAEERFNEVQNRVEAQLRGTSKEAVEMDFFGLDIETEE